MIEVCTVNGFRRAINPISISTVNECSQRMGKSNSVIVMQSGETIFCDDTYDAIMTYYNIMKHIDNLPKLNDTEDLPE